MYIESITYNPINPAGFDSIPLGSQDDSNYFVELPLDFDVNFLDVNYTSVYVGTNSYLTFGGGASNNDIIIPGEIPETTGLPGVYLSTFSNTGNACLDSILYYLYTGTTDGGNTVVIRFEGNDDYGSGGTNLVYNFVFYKDQTEYFDLVIEQNEVFCNDDPTGGLSDGINPTWLATFSSEPLTAYRIYNAEPTPSPVSANTEYFACVICSGNTNTVQVPHPVYTNNYGNSVTQMNAVTIGGNGLNS